MSVLKTQLKVSNQNSLSSYFPSRTSNNAGDFDWDVAQGIVIRNLYKKAVSSKLVKVVKNEKGEKIDKTLDNFRKQCREDFEKRLNENEFWAYIERMYFLNNAFYEIAPESLLFKITSLTSSSAKNRLGDLFSSIMGGFYITELTSIERNFLEQQVVDSLRDPNVLEDFDGRCISKGINEKPYLPFLTRYFCKDLEFLAAYPKYMIENLKDCLKLYAYLYTAQLALNIKGWRSLDEPSSKPLYFIMENEIASKERTDLVNNGHQKVSKLFENIFPYLTMSEYLQEINKDANQHRLPLWAFASKLTKDDSLSLRKYTEAFARNRSKDPDYHFSFDESKLEDPHYWLEMLLKLSLKQFDKGETRAKAQNEFIKTTEVELCSTFVRNRGRVGKVLVINQDFLALLTNLAIGKNEKFRFHELLEEFKERGIYFDKQTHKSLIQFYERVGNVERMSDSGDAVYVRKTV